MSAVPRSGLPLAILAMALFISPAVTLARSHTAPRVSQHTILKAQGKGPDQVHSTAAFTVPRAWRVHYVFSCIDSPGRPSIFSIVLTSARDEHRGVRRVATVVASQGQGTVRQTGAGRFRLRIVSPCVWNLEILR